VGRWNLNGWRVGRRAFVKAVGSEPNPDSPGIHRAEARAMAVLPRSAPAPRMRWSLDQDGWVALAFEDVDGVHPTLPWRPGELTRVLAMVADLAAALTPAPPGLPTLRSFQLGQAWPRSTGCGAGPAGPEAGPGSRSGLG
jgi:hypothetical protein